MSRLRWASHELHKSSALGDKSPARSFFFASLAFVTAMLALAAQSAAQPPGGKGELVMASIEVQKLEPEHPTEGQPEKIYFTLTNLLPTPTSGWVAANFAGVPNQPGDTNKRINGLASNESVSDVITIVGPPAGSSSTLIVYYYKNDFAQIGKFRRLLLAKAELDVDIAHSYITKRISGQSYFTLSRPDPHDSASDVNGYLFVKHDPGCGVVGNDGTDKFFVSRPLPPGAKITRADFRQFWPNKRGCDDPWSWLNDSGSYNTRFDTATDSIRWHNACQGPYGGKNLYYAVSFLVTMPTGTDLGEPVYDAADNAPLPPGDYSIGQAGKPDCSSQPPPPTPMPHVISIGPDVNPHPIQPKMPFSVSYVIQNIGTKASESFDVSLYIDGIAENGTRNIPKLDPNQSTTIEWSVSKEFSPSFTHSLDLRVGSQSFNFSQQALY